MNHRCKGAGPLAAALTMAAMLAGQGLGASHLEEGPWEEDVAQVLAEHGLQLSDLAAVPTSALLEPAPALGPSTAPVASCIGASYGPLWFGYLHTSTDAAGCPYEQHAGGTTRAAMACEVPYLAVGSCLAFAIQHPSIGLGFWLLFCDGTGVMTVDWSEDQAYGYGSCDPPLTVGRHPTTWTSWYAVQRVDGTGAAVSAATVE